MTDVLLVSYYFPPSGGPGVQRVLKFARYLPRFGYRPVVLTVPEDSEFPARDRSLLEEIPPEVRVARSSIIEFYDLYRRFSGRRDDEPVDIQSSDTTSQGIRDRMIRKIRGSIFIPDGRVGWLNSGTRAGLQLCREEKIRAIVATGPPFTAHWIAKRISRRTGLPLVLDFRDPWTRAPFYPERPSWARKLDERLERSCLRTARRVITVNRAIRDDFLTRYPDLDPEKFEVIPNGYDAADFAPLRRNPGDRWTLSYTGSLFASGTPHALFDALRDWLNEEPELVDSLKLRFAGRLDPAIRRILDSPPFDRIASFEGYLPHRESVQLLLDSDLLLLLVAGTPENKGMLTGKLFEYIGSGTPVLALAPEGEAAELIRETGAGRIVPFGDRGAILQALRTAFEAYRKGNRAFGKSDPEKGAAYTREALTRRLARELDSLLD